MAAIPSYRADMVGLSERDRTLLRSLLAASQARAGIRWDGGPAQPVVYFTDIDGQAGADFWQSLSEAERRDAAIVISITQPQDAARWLPKPLRSATLLGVLEQLKQVVRAPVAPAPAAAPAAGSPKAKRIVDPNEPLRLLDVLDDVAATTARAVQSPHWPDLVLGGGNTHAMRTVPLEIYIEGFAASIDVSRVTKYTGGPLDDAQRIDIDTLRWLAVLHAPLAEIARRLPHPAKARLATLPAFGHLPHTLAQVRMAAWLTQHSASPQELAEMAGVDDEAVLRFLGACDAIGLLQEVSEAPAAPAPTTMTATAAANAPAPTPTPTPMSTPAPAPASVSASAPVVAATPAAAAPTQITVTPVPPAPVTAPPEPVIVQPAESIAAAASTLAEPPPAPVESASQSVLERLREAREQNRARVAAAIRGISSNQ
jgi:hypothetical protein